MTCVASTFGTCSDAVGAHEAMPAADGASIVNPVDKLARASGGKGDRAAAAVADCVIAASGAMRLGEEMRPMQARGPENHDENACSGVARSMPLGVANG